MEHSDYYNDRKYCESCGEYVTYLQGMEHSYCTQCGQQVRLFSGEDWEAFQTSLKDRRPKGGRPKKKKESA